MIKIYALFLFLIPFVFGQPNKTENATADDEAPIEWLTMEEAYNRNKKEPRKIIVDVYTDWCGWCKKMDKDTFADQKVANYVNKHYYAVKLNAEGKKSLKIEGETFVEAQIAQQLRVSSYPTVVFIEKDFKTFQPVPGYRKAADFLDVLVKFQEGAK